MLQEGTNTPTSSIEGMCLFGCVETSAVVEIKNNERNKFENRPEYSMTSIIHHGPSFLQDELDYAVAPTGRSDLRRLRQNYQMSESSG